MLKGIDVSRYQGVDYNLREAGLAFAFIKASEGLFQDPQLQRHASEVGSTYLFRGFYHFYRDNFDPERQALYFWQKIQPYLDVFSLPPVLDLEDPNVKRDPVTFGARVMAFLRKLEALSGYRPIVYTNKNFITQRLGGSHFLALYKLWDACYEKNPATPYCGWPAPSFWQFTDHSAVTGEAAPLDGDLFMGTPAQLMALTKAAVCKGNLDPETWAQRNNIKIF